jgi:TolB-like protein/DNA-binding winged helix-turn-helix (wHTH) protein/Tfp pilus assembly protein PilF
LASPSQDRRIIRFGAFELDVQSGELRKQGLKTRLPPQSFQVLQRLLERPREVVTREELRQELWPADTFVDFEMGVSSAVKKLREALGDSAENPRFVETLPRRGYRFIAPIDEPAANGPAEPARGVVAPGAAEPAAVVVATGEKRRLHRTRGRAAMAALAIALAAAATWTWRQGHAASAPIHSLAVLPFENLTGNPDQDYFADGVTETLTTNLAQIRALRVISRTSAMQYRHAKKSLPEIARELDVEAVVEGAVGRSGDRVRVTAQLIDARTDRHVWAKSYDRELRDVLALQSEVAWAIAQAVQVEVGPEERRRLSRTASVHPDAYESYLKGRYYWGLRGRENFIKAAAYFQQATTEDPGYAPAYSGLSDTRRMFDEDPPLESMPKAEAAARKALALDDTLAEAHASLAGVLYRYHWQWAAAEKEFQRALELDPNYAEGHRAYAIFLLTMRRNAEALPEARLAQGLSPLSAVMGVELAFALARLERYDEAAERLRKTRELDPAFPRVDQTLALMYLQQGDLPRAVTVLEERKARLGRPLTPAGAWLGYLLAKVGRSAEAEAVLHTLEERSQRHYLSPQSFAIVQLGLGHKDAALTLLGKACEQRSIDVLGFSGPLFDLLRDEPRYRELIGRMGLGEAYFPSGRRAATSG